MVMYNPADPLGWAAIKAEQDAQAAGVNAAGGTRYVLPSMGDDPEMIAYLTQYDFGRTQAQADAELRKRQAADAYEQALRSLEQQGVQGARDTDNSLLSRGVFGSGERTVRQEDMRRALGQGRSQADTQYSQQIGSVDSDLNRALTQMDLERERQIVASKARIADAQRQGAIEAGVYGGGPGSGGGGGGGSTTAPAAAPPQVATGTPPVPLSRGDQAAGARYAGMANSGAYSTPAKPPAPTAAKKPGYGASQNPTAPRKPRNYPQQTRY